MLFTKRRGHAILFLIPAIAAFFNAAHSKTQERPFLHRVIPLRQTDVQVSQDGFVGSRYNTTLTGETVFSNDRLARFRSYTEDRPSGAKPYVIVKILRDGEHFDTQYPGVTNNRLLPARKHTYKAVVDMRVTTNLQPTTSSDVVIRVEPPSRGLTSLGYFCLGMGFLMAGFVSLARARNR